MKPNRPLLSGKVLFFSSLGAVLLTVATVFVSGLPSHRSFEQNGIYSVSILWICMMIFLTVNLYRGVEVSDDFGYKLKARFLKSRKKSDSGYMPDVGGLEIPDVGDDLLSIVGAILLWILITVVFVFLVIFFQALLWMMLVWTAMVFYWILIRAYRLIFRRSGYCKGDYYRSLRIAVLYSFLYAFWFYLIFFVSAMF